MSDHVHVMISIPPKYSVAQVIGYFKGKSAIHVARVYGERKRNFVGQRFWARGYFVSTVGRDEAVTVSAQQLMDDLPVVGVVYADQHDRQFARDAVPPQARSTTARPPQDVGRRAQRGLRVQDAVGDALEEVCLLGREAEVKQLHPAIRSPMPSAPYSNYSRYPPPNSAPKPDYPQQFSHSYSRPNVRNVGL